MYRFSQNSQDIVINVPMMLKDGTQATTLTINSFTTAVIQPDGIALTDFTPPTITNPVSSGIYSLKFPTTASSKALTTTTSFNLYTVVLDHPETDVEPFQRDVAISNGDFNGLISTTDSTNSTVGSIYTQVSAESTTTFITVDLENGIPRVEAGDTFQFIRNLVTVPDSGATYQIKDPAGTIVATGTAVQSGTSANFYFNYTTTTSIYTTVDSSGWHLAIWTVGRTTGDDIIRDKFEVVRTTV